MVGEDGVKAAAGAHEATPPLPEGVRTVRERPVDGAVPIHVHPDWARTFPWLVQGTTGASGAFDLGLYGGTPVGTVLARWRALREALGVPTAVHSRQVHGAGIRRHGDPGPGLLVEDGHDGHVTDQAGVLLTVSVADCVPISLVDPERRRIALLHGGWRGTAAGILGRGFDALGAEPASVWVHLGPAICGRCYEVGPEVHEALGLAPPPANTPVDVRAVQAREAVGRGVPPRQVTVSEHCTLCGSGFFSHRGGSGARQMGLLAVRP